MQNRKFNNLPLLDQIKRLHQQIHRLNGVLNNGSSKFTPTYIPFGDGDGDLTESSNFLLEAPTDSKLSSHNRLVINPQFGVTSLRPTHSVLDVWAQYNTLAHGSNMFFETDGLHIIGGGSRTGEIEQSRVFGDFEDYLQTGIADLEVPLKGQGIASVQYRPSHSTKDHALAGMHEVTVNTVRVDGDVSVDYYWNSVGPTTTTAPTSSNAETNIFRLDGETKAVELSQYGAATPTQTIANTGGTYTNNSTIPFFSNEGILTESDDFYIGKNPSGTANTFLSIGGVKDVPLNTGNSTFTVFEATNPSYGNTFAVTDDQTFLYKGSHGYQAFHISIHGGTDNRNAATFDPVGRAGASPGGYRISAATNGSGTGSTGDFQVSMLAEVNVEEDGLNMKLSNGPFTNQDTYTWITLLAKNKAIQFARFNRPTLEQTTADTNGNYTKRSTIPFFSDEGTVTESSNIVLGHSSLYPTRNAQLLINHQNDSMSGWTTFAAQAGENTASGAMQIQVNDGGFELAGYKNQGSNFNRYYSTGTVAETITETTPLITAGQGIAQNIFWVKHNGLTGQKLFGRDSVTVNTVRPDGHGNVDFKWFTNKSVGTGVQDQDLFELNADGHIIFHQYGTGIQDATTLSKTPSTGLAQFATDGTILDKAISVQPNTLVAAGDGTLLTNEVFMVTNGDGTSALHIKN
jgi:hypothetical protein